MDLLPGDLVVLGGQSAVFITRTQHPIFPSLQLVIWKMPDGWDFEWSLDALSADQEVGVVIGSTGDERMERLRKAMLGSSS
jgi:hypothetical protein